MKTWVAGGCWRMHSDPLSKVKIQEKSSCKVPVHWCKHLPSQVLKYHQQYLKYLKKGTCSAEKCSLTDILSYEIIKLLTSMWKQHFAVVANRGEASCNSFIYSSSLVQLFPTWGSGPLKGSQHKSVGVTRWSVELERSSASLIYLIFKTLIFALIFGPWTVI